MMFQMPTKFTFMRQIMQNVTLINCQAVKMRYRKLLIKRWWNDLIHIEGNYSKVQECWSGIKESVVSWANVKAFLCKVSTLHLLHRTPTVAIKTNATKNILADRDQWHDLVCGRRELDILTLKKKSSQVM